MDDDYAWRGELRGLYDAMGQDLSEDEQRVEILTDFAVFLKLVVDKGNGPAVLEIDSSKLSEVVVKAKVHTYALYDCAL